MFQSNDDRKATVRGRMDLIQKERLKGPPSKPIEKHTIGMRIELAREVGGISQEGLAARIGVAPETLDAWEKGREFPSLDMVNVVADELEMNRAYLLGVENGMTIRVLRNNTFYASLFGLVLTILVWYLDINSIIVLDSMAQYIVDLVALGSISGPLINYYHWNKQWRSDRINEE